MMKFSPNLQFFFWMSSLMVIFDLVNKVMYSGVDMYVTVILISNKMFRTMKLAIKVSRIANYHPSKL